MCCPIGPCKCSIGIIGPLSDIIGSWWSCPEGWVWKWPAHPLDAWSGGWGIMTQWISFALPLLLRFLWHCDTVTLANATEDKIVPIASARQQREALGSYGKLFCKRFLWVHSRLKHEHHVSASIELQSVYDLPASCFYRILFIFLPCFPIVFEFSCSRLLWLSRRASAKLAVGNNAISMSFKTCKKR